MPNKVARITRCLCYNYYNNREWFEGKDDKFQFLIGPAVRRSDIEYPTSFKVMDSYIKLSDLIQNTQMAIAD